MTELPVEGFPTREHRPDRICEHFMCKNWKAKVDTIQEIPTPLPQ